jgi:hypothetical protein
LLHIFSDVEKTQSNLELYVRVIDPDDSIRGESRLTVQLQPVAFYTLPFFFRIKDEHPLGQWRIEFVLRQSEPSTDVFVIQSGSFSVVRGWIDIFYRILLGEIPLVALLGAILSVVLTIAGWLIRPFVRSTEIAGKVALFFCSATILTVFSMVLLSIVILSFS